GRALVLSVAGFGLATIVFGLSRNVLLSFAMLTLAGALDKVSVVIRGTLVQLLTPDSMRGRVSAGHALVSHSSDPPREFESGVAADGFGAIPSVGGGGVGTILVVLGAMVRWPVLIRLGALRPEEVLPPEDVPGPEVAAIWRQDQPEGGIQEGGGTTIKESPSG